MLIASCTFDRILLFDLYKHDLGSWSLQRNYSTFLVCVALIKDIFFGNFMPEIENLLLLQFYI